LKQRTLSQVVSYCKNIGTQGVQGFFFSESKVLEVTALTGLLTVMIRLIKQVCLVTMYSAEKKKSGFASYKTFFVIFIKFSSQTLCNFHQVFISTLDYPFALNLLFQFFQNCYQNI